jgi:hypothetical protein
VNNTRLVDVPFGDVPVYGDSVEG